METRQITQVHIFYIVLNSVYDRCEDRTIVAVSGSRERLLELYDSSLLPSDKRFRDDYGKYRSFKKGPLYEFNPSWDGDFIGDDWIPAADLDTVKQRYVWVE